MLRVDERPVVTLGEASMALTAAAMDRRDVRLEVRIRLTRYACALCRCRSCRQFRQGADPGRLYWQSWLQPALVDSLTPDSVVAGQLQPGT